MGNPRKPTALHLLQGSEQKNPGRMKLRANEPQPPEAIGSWVDHAGETPAQAWDFLVSCAAPGVFTNMDRPSLMIASELMSRFWSGQIDGSSLGRLHALMASFGMTPADRSKIIVLKPAKPDNPFAKFRRA